MRHKSTLVLRGRTSAVCAVSKVILSSTGEFSMLNSCTICYFLEKAKLQIIILKVSEEQAIFRVSAAKVRK